MTQRPEAPTDAVFTAARTSDPVASINRVADAYGSPEVDIEGILGAEISPDDPDRAVIEPWAAAVDGPILDVGAGTGRWTGHLARLGHTVEGLEPSDRLITIARARHPAVVFHHDSIEDLARCEIRWGGILAWYSTIHMSSEELLHALATLRTRLGDGGSLLMSFFAGPRLEAFDHPIAAAYRWPMNKMVEALTHAGFEVIGQRSNPRTPHAYITARATPGFSRSAGVVPRVAILEGKGRMPLAVSTDVDADPANDLCVARVPLFQGLTHAQQVEVAGFARTVRLDAVEQAYTAGSDMSQLMVVHTGQVKIARTSAAGHEQVIRVLGPGDFIGESAFLTGTRPDHAAEALVHTELCVFRHADLGRLVEKHPSIGLRMLQGVSQRLDDTEARLASVISGNVSSRLADYLLSLPATPGPRGATDVTLPLAKKDIASLLSTTPESLSRQLRKLTDTGVISQQEQGRITITDVTALTALSTLSKRD